MIKVPPAQNIEEGIEYLINASNLDYARDIDNTNMIEQFKNSWVVKSGKKFIKIISIGLSTN